jgi:hypothetical protein
MDDINRIISELKTMYTETGGGVISGTIPASA